MKYSEEELKFINDMLWELDKKSKREVMGLCIELFIKFEALKLQLEKGVPSETPDTTAVTSS